MYYLLFAGSLRKDSLNKKFIGVANEILKSKGLETKIIDLKDLKLPVYDGDIESAGMPEGVTRLGELVANAKGIIISGPEYNGSISGSLKNTIDWVSRLRPVPWERKPVLLLGASPGAYGASHGLAATKPPFERLGAYVYPQVLGLSKAHEAFDESNNLKDDAFKSRLDKLLGQFQEYVSRF